MAGEISEEKRQQILADLQAAFPHGHPGFIPMMLDAMELHSRKNYDYAKGGNPLGNFDRVAAIFALYPGLNLGDPKVIALVYEMKQMDAILWMLCQKYEGKVEGYDSRAGDVQVYTSLFRLINQDQAAAKALASKVDF